MLLDLARSYLSQENTIILAVTNAANEVENSQAFPLAREFDPTGKRTIGVITRVDNREQGTEIRRYGIF